MQGDRKNKIAAILGDQKHRAPEAPMDELEAAVQEMVDAVHAKDVAGVAAALRACVAICESENRAPAEE